MAHPVERPLFQLLEPLLVIERQIHIVQQALESFTEVHDVLEDTQLPAAAHSLQLIIHRLQDLQVQQIGPTRNCRAHPFHYFDRSTALAPSSGLELTFHVDAAFCHVTTC